MCSRVGDTWSLVYPDIPTPCTVLVVVEQECNILVENIKQSLRGTGITVLVKRLEDVETVMPCNLVVATMLGVNMACKVNTLARDNFVPFIYCQIVPGNLLVFYDQGEEIHFSHGGQLRDDGLPVHVGDVIKGDTSSIITCDRTPHGLLVGDKVMVGTMETVVMDVMGSKEVKVSHGDGDCKQGDLVQRILRTDVSGHRSLSSCLDRVPDPEQALTRHSTEYSPVYQTAAGLVSAAIVDAVTGRCTLENTIQKYSLPSINMEHIRDMEDKSVLVFGWGELAITLIKSLVMLKVKLITVLYMSKVQEKEIENLSTSLGKTSAKIECYVFDPSNQDMPSLQAVWSQASCVLCAGGTIEERMLVHSWGVQLSRPGVDIAVQGRLGHVEPLVPHLTTSYTCTSSPSDHQPPYCVIKSFPHLPEHAAIWAKDKLTNLLQTKPSICQQFLADHTQSHGSLSASQELPPAGSAVTYKLLTMFGQNPTWEKCVHIARQKFEKYFAAKALQLQSNFSPDTTISSGALFWSWPKLYPGPLVFSHTNPDHMEFVGLLAVGLARIFGVKEEDWEGPGLVKILESANVAPFVSKNKKIITDESVAADTVVASNENVDLVKLSSLLCPTLKLSASDLPTFLSTRLSVITCHLRCDMYDIPRASNQQVQSAMGYLEPCLPSTVQCVTGLGIAEMVNIFTDSGRHCNWWVGQGQVIHADTVKPPSTRLSPHISVTLWDKLEIQGNSSTTLQDFLDMMKIKYQLEVTMVVQDSRMVYVPIMPGHKNRLHKVMTSLVKNPDSTGTVLLSVTAAAEGEEEDLSLPPVRYVLG